MSAAKLKQTSDKNTHFILFMTKTKYLSTEMNKYSYLMQLKMYLVVLDCLNMIDFPVLSFSFLIKCNVDIYQHNSCLAIPKALKSFIMFPLKSGYTLSDQPFDAFMYSFSIPSPSKSLDANTYLIHLCHFGRCLILLTDTKIKE